MSSASIAGHSAAEIMGFLGDHELQRQRFWSTGGSNLQTGLRTIYPSNLQLSEQGDRQVRGFKRRQSSHGSSESQSSIFDGADEESQSSFSSAPSQTGPELPNRERPTLPFFDSPLVESTHAGRQGPSLPCEFLWYDNCEESFGLTGYDAWVEHMLTQHLDRTLPRKLICWICEENFEARSDLREEKKINYRERICHIAEHFRGVKQFRISVQIISSSTIFTIII
ncbi:hypothetical protein PT974_10132 [Cladobotryum mycophilum]|uniref:Uncharacterized protein n=1 Tax=Cladobotryum mycophilum TaxID=491253 RepID=A0ABR0S907_9HYPO